MDSPKATDVKAHIRICSGCEQRLTHAVNTMRRHCSQLAAATKLANAGMSEEERQEAAAGLADSFREAQSAWDAYREHLIEHGILPGRE